MGISYSKGKKKKLERFLSPQKTTKTNKALEQTAQGGCQKCIHRSLLLTRQLCHM